MDITLRGSEKVRLIEFSEYPDKYKINQNQLITFKTKKRRGDKFYVNVIEGTSKAEQKIKNVEKKFQAFRTNDFEILINVNEEITFAEIMNENNDNWYVKGGKF
jgi:hypothetical protein